MEGDDLIPKEIGEFLVGIGWDAQDEDISDLGCVRIAGLHDVLAKVRQIAKCGITNLVAFEGQPTPRTEASPITGVQHFTEDRDNEIMIVVVGAVELGHEAVGRPGVGFPVEVGHEVELGEGIAAAAEVIEAPSVHTAGGVAGCERSLEVQDRSRHSNEMSDGNSNGWWGEDERSKPPLICRPESGAHRCF